MKKRIRYRKGMMKERRDENKSFRSCTSHVALSYASPVIAISILDCIYDDIALANLLSSLL